MHLQPLEVRPLQELRGLAKAFGIKFSFRDQPRDLAERLNGSASLNGLTSLEDRSLVELRTIAQSLKVEFTLADDKERLVNSIDAMAKTRMPKLNVYAPQQPTDTRLRSKPPSRAVTQKQLTSELQKYFALGLRLSFPTEDQWIMGCGFKEDSGSMYMPLRALVNAARKVMG